MKHFAFILSLILCSQALGAYTPNAVTNSVAKTRIEGALISGAGACAVTTQTGTWIASVNHVGTGVCTLTFTSGIWSSAPYCFVTVDNVANSVARMGAINASATTSAVQIMTNSSAPAAADYPFTVICFGLR